MLVMINTRVVGVGEYRISAAEAGVIDARYTTSDGVGGFGRAWGNTLDGFAGSYRVQYFDAAGKLTGHLDLRIQPDGDSYRLTWRHRQDNVPLPVGVGEVVYEGVGLQTGDTTMALAYWMSDRVSLALDHRPLL
jgi:hypothetical protein